MQIGIALATFSGFLFTANNFLIQYFAIGALEILLVRSIVQGGIDPNCIKIGLPGKLILSKRASIYDVLTGGGGLAQKKM